MRQSTCPVFEARIIVNPSSCHRTTTIFHAIADPPPLNFPPRSPRGHLRTMRSSQCLNLSRNKRAKTTEIQPWPMKIYIKLWGFASWNGQITLSSFENLAKSSPESRNYQFRTDSSRKVEIACFRRFDFPWTFVTIHFRINRRLTEELSSERSSKSFVIHVKSIDRKDIKQKKRNASSTPKINVERKRLKIPVLF